MSKKPTVLMILDGYGLNEKTEGNAVAEAKTPVMDELRLAVQCLKPREHAAVRHHLVDGLDHRIEGGIIKFLCIPVIAVMSYILSCRHRVEGADGP